MSHDKILEQIRLDPEPGQHATIRDLWKRHSIAEDNRDLDGLISTLTPDCVYEVVNTGSQWTGHEGARAFYTELLGAFPDIHFDLQHIVIGPQGVCEEAIASGTHEHQWQSLSPSGKRVEFRVVIFFPWDPARELFRGERVYFHAPDLV